MIMQTTSSIALDAVTASHHSNLLYLPKSMWSARYDSNFYSVTLDGYQVMNDAPPDVPVEIFGNKNLPAVYFSVSLHRQHTRMVHWRRFSQFVWLHREWTKRPPVVEREAEQLSRQLALPHFPFDFLFFWWLLPFSAKESFLKKRQLDLAAWLDEMLSRPGYANHPATIVFLRLKGEEREETKYVTTDNDT